MDDSTQAIAYLRSTQAIRDRCHSLLELACADKLTHFRCHLDRLEPTAEFVIRVMQAAYPEGNIPFHSRWRHFEAGGIDRLGQLQRQWANLSPIEQARAKFDLVMTSVLLDAGAGAAWRYREPGTEQMFQRSEGLAVASFHLFLQGGFSSAPDVPWQADAKGLYQFTEAKLAQGFQVTEQNPLIGLTGRVQLMQQLGQVIQRQPHRFGQPVARPGYLVDYLLQQATDGKLKAHQVFEAVLEGLSDIWPGRISIAEVNLGDVWVHSALPMQGVGSQLVSFHKLSQWLTYSLLEPLQDLGVQITDLNQLTGLAEYRNGGLCLDTGLLEAKHDAVMGEPHPVGSEIIVEWRALTVALLDRLADTIRQRLHRTEHDFPLVKVLEGGTWAAGRQIAAEKRAGGVPPIQIQSDGTVF